jgi:hypothetical protein
LAVVIYAGAWPLLLDPWKARFRVAVREDSALSRILTGKIRATALALFFTVAAVLLLAWQALSVGVAEGAILVLAAFTAGSVFAAGQSFLAHHFHQPFARAIATSVVTWIVAIPFALILSLSTWAWAAMPGSMLDASFSEALRLGLDRLPARGGWIAEVLAVPYAYDAAKLWLVVQLRDYPLVAVAFSLDAALVSFVLCRVSIVATQFAERQLPKRQA